MTPPLARRASVPCAPRRSDDPLEQALRLRSLGLSYSAIAAVMGEYHDVYYEETWWRQRVRAMGARGLRVGMTPRRTEAIR